MSVDTVSEDALREALVPLRVTPSEFETGVRRKMAALQPTLAAEVPLIDSPFLQTAASILPLPLMTTGKLSAQATSLVPLAFGFRLILYKLLAFAAFPASLLFVVLGTWFTFHSLRNARPQSDVAVAELQEALRLWLDRHKWSMRFLIGLVIVLPLAGAPALLLLLLLISIASLFWVTISLARRGLIDRDSFGQSCRCALCILAMATSTATVGLQGLHFYDQALIPAVLCCGAFVLAFFVGQPRAAGQWAPYFSTQLFFGALVLGLIVWFAKPTLWPPSSSQIKRYVESFEMARFSTASWRQWEPVASWAIESEMAPDLSAPRRLLNKEIDGAQNPIILSYAFRVGLVDDAQIGQLRDYDANRQRLLEPLSAAQKILSLNQSEWVIRAMVARGDLTSQQRDHLEARLLATLDSLSVGDFEVLNTALLVTNLLDAIDRPVDRDRYRDAVYSWLRDLQSKRGGGFQVAGGFKQLADSRVGSAEATWWAIRLMEIYGVPEDVDLNWVRGFLRPLTTRQLSDQRWIPAVARDQLRNLPGAEPPSWLTVVYYEQGLVMAVVLVGLCIGVTCSIPAATSRPGHGNC